MRLFYSKYEVLPKPYSSLRHVLNIIEVTIIIWKSGKLRYWFHFGTKSTQDIVPRSTFASFLIRCCNDWLTKLNTWILQWCKCSKVQSRMRFIGLLSLTSALEPVYHWALYLRDLFTAFTWTVKCVIGEEMKPGETHMGVSGVNPGTVASGLLLYSKYSSASSWQIKCHLFGCFIILMRKHFQI